MAFERRSHMSRIVLHAVVACSVVPGLVHYGDTATLANARPSAAQCSYRDPECLVLVSGTLTAKILVKTAALKDLKSESSGKVTTEVKNTNLEVVETVSLSGGRRGPKSDEVPAKISVSVSYTHSDLFHTQIEFTCHDVTESTLHTWGRVTTQTGQTKYTGVAHVSVPDSPRSDYLVYAAVKAGTPILHIVDRQVSENAVTCPRGPNDPVPSASPSPGVMILPSIFGIEARAHGKMVAGSPAILSGSDTGIMAPLYSDEKGATSLTFQWHLSVTHQVEPLAPLTK